MKLNLGCGNNKMDGFINIDKYQVFKPDVVCDLEFCPWPFKDNSVDKIVAHHVMEHLGQTAHQFMDILAELYRICKSDALIEILVPHPHHYTFTGDPTHIRVVTPEQFSLFDRDTYPDHPLRKSSGLEFKVIEVFYQPEHLYRLKLDANEITYEEVLELGKYHLNVLEEIRMLIQIIKK